MCSEEAGYKLTKKRCIFITYSIDVQKSECQERPLSATTGGKESQHPGQLPKQVQHLGERCSRLSWVLLSFRKPSIHTTETTNTFNTITYGDTAQSLLVVKRPSLQGVGTTVSCSVVISSLVV